MRDYLYALLIMLVVTVVTAVGTMEVTLYRSGEGVAAPSVTGLSVSDALDRVDRVGLALTVTGLAYSPTVEKEGIVTQTPEAGKTLLPGEAITVTVSRGSRTVILPELAGLPLAQARTILSTNRLKSPDLLRIPADQAEETVLAQQPAAGEMVTREEKPALLVSAGPAPRYVMAPDFTGMPLSTVMNKIKRLDLRVARVTYTPNDRVEKGVVLSQEPTFGKRMGAGSFVTLNVSDGGGESKGEDGVTFLYFTVPDRPAPVRVTLSQENENGTKEIYDRIHRPGDTFSILVSIAGETMVKIFLDNELADVRRFSPKP